MSTELTKNGGPGGSKDLAAASLRLTIAYYLRTEGDFNGLPMQHLAEVTRRAWPELQDAVVGLIQAGAANLHWEDVDLNPHINRRGFASVDAQVEQLKRLDSAPYHTCLYPGREHLAAVVPAQAYANRPYSRELALGEAQLEHRSFDLQVLETYRNDPRYYYTCSDIGGSICISTEHSEGAQRVRESDQVLVETFGFSYDERKDRSVAVYLRYLHDLSSEHQQIWRARELPNRERLHPDYYRSTVLGEWGAHLPLLQAMCMEIWLINQMSKAVRGEALFRRDFGEHGEDRPKRLALLIRPTLEEFNAAVLLLDKVLSDNISTAFFEGVVALETERERADGKVEVQRKGTITLLDEYLRSVYRTADWSPWDEAVAALRAVRKLRQSPAHAVDADVFDPRYASEFRQLCARAYGALLTLRSCLQRHPAVRKAGIEVPPQLEDGKVWME